MRRATAALALALAPLAACGGAPEPAQFAGRPVCLIVVDTLRADHFPGYPSPPFGPGRPPAPLLERLGRDGVLFERAWSTSSWTAPATASIFTGLVPERHGVLGGLNLYRHVRERQGEDAPRLNRIPEPLETLPEVFRDLGYTTLGVADNPNVCERMGFADGFDRLETSDYVGAEAVTDLAIRWLGELDDADRPWFLYLHYMDPHAPYHARPPLETEAGLAAADVGPLEGVRRRYASEVAYLDAQLARLVEETGLLDRALVVVTADHGEEIGDHGKVGHGPTLFEELVRVPLVFHDPARLAPGRVATPASLADLAPTLRELVGAPPAAVADGLSLAGLLRAPGARAGAELEDRTLPLHRLRDGAVRRVELHGAVEAGRLKLVREVGEGEALFDLEADPREVTDAAPENPEAVERLREALRALRARPAPHPREFAPPRATTAEERAVLERLGYIEEGTVEGGTVGGNAPAPAPPEDG